MAISFSDVPPSYNTMPVTTPKDGLFRASLVLEYDDGTVHTLRVEHPFDARAQVNYPDVHPVDIYLGEPTYLPLLAGQLEVVVRMKAGESPVIYRHDD